VTFVIGFEDSVIRIDDEGRNSKEESQHVENHESQELSMLIKDWERRYEGGIANA